MLQIYHTEYENTKRKISIAYFNKTYNNPRPIDIGTFVLKRNFLHVHFSHKLKPLRIGPFKIINKISDITYDAYDAHHISRMTDTISAHNHEKIIDFSSVKRIYFHFLKNPAERKFELSNNKE